MISQLRHNFLACQAVQWHHNSEFVEPSQFWEHLWSPSWNSDTAGWIAWPSLGLWARGGKIKRAKARSIYRNCLACILLHWSFQIKTQRWNFFPALDCLNKTLTLNVGTNSTTRMNFRRLSFEPKKKVFWGRPASISPFSLPLFDFLGTAAAVTLVKQCR